MNVRIPYQGQAPVQAAPPAPPAEPTPRERIARFKTLARRAVAYWRISLVILVLGSAGALVAALNVKLIYKSECTILYKPAMGTGDRREEGERASRVGEKLKDLLVTRTRLEALVKEFGLYPKIVDSRGMVEAVEEMRTHIGFRARDSETFVISFENEVADTTPKVTTALATSMMNEFANSSLSTAKQEADFLSKQEQRSALDVENANKALATFLTLHPEFAVEARTGGTATPGAAMAPTLPHVPKEGVQTLGDPQLAVLYRQKSRLEAELRSNAGSPGPGPTTPVPTGVDSIAKLTVQRDQAAKAAAAAAVDLTDKRMRLTDAHPDVISAKITAEGAARQLRQAELALAAAQGAQGGQTGNPYEAPSTDANVQRRIAQLNAEIAARQEAVRHASTTTAQANTDSDGGTVAAAVAETNELVQLETEWPRLLSVLHDAREEHNDLHDRLERARLTANAREASSGDQMLVIDPAYRPMRPTKGGRTNTAIGGGFLALILALAYAFARVIFNDTLIDSADVEALHIIPVLGVLPKVRPEAPAKPAKEPQRVV